jgi:hypothetical protein
MPFRVVGVRLGVQLHTDHGVARNGEINAKQRDSLKAAGYRLVECSGIPDPTPTPEERDEMKAANKFLGILPRDDGKTILEHQINKRMSDLLKPLQKKTYLDPKSWR